MDVSNKRRVLRGRRHSSAAPTADSLTPPSQAQHAVTEFKWASDRHSRQEDEAPYPLQNSTSAGIFAATTSHGHSKAGRLTSTAADAFAANEFKWISDYVDDAEGPAVCQSASWQPKAQQQQLQQQQQPPHPANADIAPKRGWCPGWHQPQQLQQQHATARGKSHSAVQPVSVAGAATAALAGPAAAAPLKATTGAAAAAASWLAGTGTGLLDYMLGFDAHLSSEDTEATAETGVKASSIGSGSQTARPAVELQRRRGRRLQERHEAQLPPPQQQDGWKWCQVLGSQQPSTSAAAAAAAAAPAAMQQQRFSQQLQASAPATAAAAAAVTNSGAASAAGATGLQPLGLIMFILGGVAALARDVTDAAGAAYSETLLPAAVLLWQLAAAVGGLLSVIVMYLLLPLLRTVTALLQRLLRGTKCMLQRCMESDDEDLGGLTAVLYAHQQRLLAGAQRQVAAACQTSGNPGSYIIADDQFRYNSRYFSSRAKLSDEAGYGPLAYEGGPEAAPVAVQLYILKDEQDLAGFCAAVEACLGFRHPQLLRCIGAAVDTVPAANLVDDTAGSSSDVALQASIAAAVGEVHKASLETSMVVVGCLVMELLQQPSSLKAAMQAAATQSSISSRPSCAAAAVPASQSFTNWSSRLQLAPQLVAGLQYLDLRLPQLFAIAHPAPAGFGTSAASTAACAHTPVMSAAAAAAATMFTWSRTLTAEQLADAVVLDAAVAPPQLKLNPALLLLRQQERPVQAAAEGVADAGAAAAAALHAGGLLIALADVLLMLLSGTVFTSGSSTAVSQGRFAQQLQHLAQSRQAAELLSAAEQAVLDAAGLQIIQQVLRQAVHLLEWQQGAEAQQQQLQQPAANTPARATTFSAAAAEAMELADEAAEHFGVGGQNSSQQHEAAGPAGAANSTSSTAVPGWFGWLSRSRSVQQQQAAAAAAATPGANGSSSGSGAAPATSSLGSSGAAAAEQPPASAAHYYERAQLLLSLQQLSDRAASWQQQQQQQQQIFARPGSCTAAEPPAYFICPITTAVMKDPVVAADGFTYERDAITRWLQQHGMRRSPMTNKPMEALLVPNHSLRSSIMEWRQQQQQQQQHS